MLLNYFETFKSYDQMQKKIVLPLIGVRLKFLFQFCRKLLFLYLEKVQTILE